MSIKVGVLASGRGSNFAALAGAEKRGDLGAAKIAVLIVNEPGAGALQRAQELGIPSLVIDHRDFRSREDFDAALVSALRERGVQIVVLAGFMRLLTPVFLEAFPNRVINVHPSLLPSFPGRDAIGDALAYGVKVTGATVHFVDEGMDTGPIILQEAVEVRDGESKDSLAARILEVGHRLLVKGVREVVLRGEIERRGVRREERG